MSSPSGRWPIVRPLDLETFLLGSGAHPAPIFGTPPGSGRACLLEAVAFVVGEDWTDSPDCVSPLLTRFGRAINDLLPDDLRQQLRPFVYAMVGTIDDDLDLRRSYVALNWLLSQYIPTWLDLAQEADAAAEVRAQSSFAGYRIALVSAHRAIMAADRAPLESSGQIYAKEHARRAALENSGWQSVATASNAALYVAPEVPYGQISNLVYDILDLIAHRAVEMKPQGAHFDRFYDVALTNGEDAFRPTVNQLQTSLVTLFGALVHPKRVKVPGMKPPVPFI